jgi:hypothetical protein
MNESEQTIVLEEKDLLVICYSIKATLNYQIAGQSPTTLFTFVVIPVS